MPSPLTTVSTLDRQLGTFVEARLAELSREFIADRVLPAMSVGMQAWTFKKIPLEELMRLDPDLRRTPGAGYKRSITQFTEDSYACLEYGYEEPIDRRERAMYGDFFPAAQIAAERLAMAIMIAREIRVAALIADNATYTGTASLNQAVTNGKWSTTATSTPINDVKLASDKMFANTGYWPTTMIISRDVFNTLKLNTQVQSVLQSSGAGDRTTMRDVNEQALAAVFNVDEIVVSGVGRNTAGLNQTPTIASIWSDDVMLVRTARTNDIQEPCIGRSFVWSADGAGMGTTEVYPEESIRSDVVRYRQDICEKRLYLEMGVMIPDVL